MNYINYIHKVKKVVHIGEKESEAICGEALSKKDYTKTKEEVTCKGCLALKKKKIKLIEQLVQCSLIDTGLRNETDKWKDGIKDNIHYLQHENKSGFNVYLKNDKIRQEIVEENKLLELLFFLEKIEDENFICLVARTLEVCIESIEEIEKRRDLSIEINDFAFDKTFDLIYETNNMIKHNDKNCKDIIKRLNSYEYADLLMFFDFETIKENMMICGYIENLTKWRALCLENDGFIKQYIKKIGGWENFDTLTLAKENIFWTLKYKKDDIEDYHYIIKNVYYISKICIEILDKNKKLITCKYKKREKKIINIDSNILYEKDLVK